MFLIRNEKMKKSDLKLRKEKAIMFTFSQLLI